MWFRRSLKNSGTPSYPEEPENTTQVMLMSQRRRFPRCTVTVTVGAAPTRECVDVNHCMLACLVVNDNINTKQGHAQSLPQRPGQLPDHIVVGWLRHSFNVLSLREKRKGVDSKYPIGKYSVMYTRRAATVVRSEDDSGLDTLWLLKKMAFLSEEKKKKQRNNSGGLLQTTARWQQSSAG